MKSEEEQERIFEIADQLAQFEAAKLDESLLYLLDAVASLIGACNASCLTAFRMSEEAPGDPLKGWRGKSVRYLRNEEELKKSAAVQWKLHDRGQPDITSIRNMEGAGTWRSHRLDDLIEPDWYESEYYQAFYRGLGFTDAVWVGCPVSEEAEVFLGFYRNESQPRFSEKERDLALLSVRGLRWFLKQILLKERLFIASAPLTPAESGVLTQLLTGKSEKEIAHELNQSRHTTHGHVKAIYRKFGVSNRPSLMALWMGECC